MDIMWRRPRDQIRTDDAAGVTDTSPGANLLICAAPTFRQLRILLVDDSDVNRMLIDAYMKKLPYIIDHAENGQLAVEMFRSSTYDLVLMDIRMPVMDGYTAVRTIREWERTQGLKRIPIIAVTAAAPDESIQRSLDAGCDAHVSKPLKKATLLQLILKLTDGADRG
jgi:two-component system sensor histidine kinase/response regulator